VVSDRIPPTGWAVMSATARGSRHDRSGAPNQDASWREVVRHADDDLVLMAVADGHGGARYVRSDVGSCLAVEIACQVARDLVTVTGQPWSRRALERHSREQLAPAIVDRWRSACLADLADRPFTDQECSLTTESMDHEPLLAYGSTLLLAILTATSSVVLQLGDGDCLVADHEGRVTLPMDADDRLVGGETTSLCLPTALSDFRFASADGMDWPIVLLATDGYGVAFADPAWRQLVMRDLARAFRDRGAGHIEAKLPGWLADSASVGGDDATVVVAFRTGGIAGGSAPRVRRSRRASPAAALAVTALTGLLVGGAAGWSLGVRDPVSDPLAAASGEDAPPDADGGSARDDEPTGQPEDGDGAPAPPDPAGDDAGDGTAGGSPAATWLTTATGIAVEFRADPLDPAPAHVDLDAILLATIARRQQVLAWGRVWSIVDGRLVVDGLELVTDPALRFGALDLENQHLWALSEEGDRLLVLDLPDVRACLVVRVAMADGADLPADLRCRVQRDPAEPSTSGVPADVR
jgi:hypothetical protein